MLAPSPTLAVPVTIVQEADGRWQLHRDGAPYVVHGVGGYAHLETAAAIGATTLRTWGIENLEHEVNGRNLLDRAHELGLTVVVGFWVTLERRPGHDADDPAALQRQRDALRAAVRRHRHHPALLIWGLGNEMELHGARASEPRIWRELETLARIIKEEDPDHPVMTVLAGAAPEKLHAIRAYYPSLDLLGVNLYGPAPLVNRMLDEAGWDKPYMLTEFGPRGQWEILQAPWGAPLEPRSGEKVVSYVSAHRAALADARGRCLGTFCFTWGQKQEATATWFGMFLPTGEKTPVVDAMAYEFTGRWPANRSPQLRSFQTPLALDRVPAGHEFPATVTAGDADDDPLDYEWQVIAESTDRKSGGAPEAAPPVIPGCIIGSGPRVIVRTPDQPGAYRLFVFVRDGHGGGCTENLPFYVQP